MSKRVCSIGVFLLFLISSLIVGCSGGENGSRQTPITIQLTGTENQVAISILETNATLQLAATTSDGSDSGYLWASSDPAIASVSANGLVTGLLPGGVQITVTGQSSGTSATLPITVMQAVPNLSQWRLSGHADSTAPAFNAWNEADPQEIPTTCAGCHSTPGFLDVIDTDGSAAGVVDTPALTGTVVTCNACHEQKVGNLPNVTFPSGTALAALGADTACTICHQGTSSSATIADTISAAVLADDDTTSAELSFPDLHATPAAAIFQGAQVQTAVTYARAADWHFRHADGVNSCTGCHDAHSSSVDIASCAGCHAGVASLEDLKNIRVVQASGPDYDGDGDALEGIYYELSGLTDILRGMIQTYGESIAGQAICIDTQVAPYFFADLDGNGLCDTNEATIANAYTSWTARLLRAAYNYQLVQSDPGAYAHNAKYLIETVYDSIEDLNTRLTSPVDTTNLVRDDYGHFNGSAEPARHWDAGPEVSATCSRCHGGAEGFRFFNDYGVGKAVEPGNGLECSTCHQDPLGGSLITVDRVVTPSAVITSGNNGTNLCASCHIGNDNKQTVDARIATGRYLFTYPHHSPAAAVYFGVNGGGGYEYSGKTYAGPWTDHLLGIENTCQYCHQPSTTAGHSFQVADSFSTFCNDCHVFESAPGDIRIGHDLDYDGDGDSAEPLADELATLETALLDEMQNYATSSAGVSICYNPVTYPYAFKDINANGSCDPEEVAYNNRFTAWTPDLMKAGFNYILSQEEPGAWAHNFDYMAQLLIDSTEDLGGPGAVSAFIRP